MHNKRYLSTILKHSDDSYSEDHWLNQFQNSLLKDAVQPRKQQTQFEQINSIINSSKSKYKSVDEAVKDMKERSGLTAYLNKTSKVSEASSHYFSMGQNDGIFDLEDKAGINIGQHIRKHRIHEHHNLIEYINGYAEGFRMDQNDLDKVLDKFVKKASPDIQESKSKKQSQPKIIKKVPTILVTIKNHINETKGNLPISAIVDHIKSIHKKDCSDDKDWDDPELLRLVSQLNMRAKADNIVDNNYSNLGRRDVFDTNIDPSNTDAFFSLMPVKR